ncbi:hypothetical protein ACU686_37440 [Yinghuangia aomiensis]
MLWSASHQQATSTVAVTLTRWPFWCHVEAEFEPVAVGFVEEQRGAEDVGLGVGLGLGVGGVGLVPEPPCRVVE